MHAFGVPGRIELASIIVHHLLSIEDTADGHTVDGFHPAVNGSLTCYEVLRKGGSSRKKREGTKKHRQHTRGLLHDEEAYFVCVYHGF